MESDGEQKLDKYYYDLFFPPTHPKDNWETSKVLYRSGGFIFGAALMSWGRNYYVLGRPVLSGLPLTIASGVLFGCFAEASRRTIIYFNDYQHRRTFHYMTLHPELFPPPERVKFADYFEEWETVR